MADNSQGTASPKNEQIYPEIGEDAETRAARRELKQSSISDPPAAARDLGSDPVDDGAARPDTPTDQVSEGQDDRLKEHVPSPKKKRAHDQLDGSIDVENNDTNSVTSTESTRDRASRLEPEKKRHRDEDSTREVSVWNLLSKFLSSPFHLPYLTHGYTELVVNNGPTASYR